MIYIPLPHTYDLESEIHPGSDLEKKIEPVEYYRGGDRKVCFRSLSSYL